ncbi:MAG: phenylacetate-CoA oxygenase subunit PaaJ [Frankiales bacterium]|nr:phenylacetate-CoA oxygenase subunit PaaJ [Frankiales bacterium]
MTTTAADVRALLAEVHDPEIPVITIEDLGILRDVEVDGRHVVVTITPTYSGCPAMQEIEHDVKAALDGWDVEVRTVLSPAWTTDWMSEAGRDKLRAYGIAPPERRPTGPVLVQLGMPRLTCPQCGSVDTEELSRFGSTSCKSMWRCRTCREPFDHFRAH